MVCRVSSIGLAASAAILLPLSGMAAAHPDGEHAAETEQINAAPRTAAIYVKDWDASVRFYTEYLNYEVMGGGPIERPKSLEAVGAQEDDTARILYLRPRNARIEREFTGFGLALIEFSNEADDIPSLERPAANRGRAVHGEVALVHEVREVERIYAAMEADPKVTIVSPLSLSGTGLSRSFSVIDPNGVRLEIYEFVQQESGSPTE